jgi:hypothetical protein
MGAGKRDTVIKQKDAELQLAGAGKRDTVAKKRMLSYN